MGTTTIRRFILSSLLLLLWRPGVPAQARQQQARPNVVILFADDLGYGDLGSYGHPTIRTPNLDRMAREGVRLTSFYAQSWCAPSRAALLTGRYPARAGFPNGSVGSSGGLPPEEITLAEVLKKEGYRTAMVGKWHLGYVREELLPTAQGFDTYFGLPYSNDMMPPWVQTDVPLRLYRNAERLEGTVDQTTLTTRYTDEAISFIRSAAGQPFFLYLAYSMPHLPIHTAERFRDRSRAGRYGDVIETIDWSAGRILDVLKAEGLDEHTIVVFTSDNGPWLNLPDRMLQSGNEPWHAGSPGLLRGSKNTTYEGGVRVPALVRWPARVPAEQTTAEIATTMDLFTTLAAAAGAEVPQDRPIDGSDLLPMLRGEAPSPTDTYYYFDHQALVGVREGAWKLHIPRKSDTRAPLPELAEPQLYHLDRDPSERYDVAGDHPEVVARLMERMQRFEAQLQERDS